MLCPQHVFMVLYLEANDLLPQGSPEVSVLNLIHLAFAQELHIL